MSLRCITITCITTPSVSYTTRLPLCTTTRAIFDPTGTYRYSLWREWCADSPPIAFIMLNPSTADDQKDDPTIRRCIGFAHAWGFGALEVVNLFAYRATDSRKLLGVDDPVGSENDNYIVQAVELCPFVVVAWGTKGVLLDSFSTLKRVVKGHCSCCPQRESIPPKSEKGKCNCTRGRQVIRLLAGKRPIGCLGVTKDGHPRHPLYVRGNTKLQAFPILSK